MVYGESNGHVTEDVTHVVLKGRHPNMLRAQYLETSGDAIWKQSLITRYSAVRQYGWLSYRQLGFLLM